MTFQITVFVPFNNVEEDKRIRSVCMWSEGITTERQPIKMNSNSLHRKPNHSTHLHFILLYDIGRNDGNALILTYKFLYSPRKITFKLNRVNKKFVFVPFSRISRKMHPLIYYFDSQTIIQTSFLGITFFHSWEISVCLWQARLLGVLTLFPLLPIEIIALSK